MIHKNFGDGIVVPGQVAEIQEVLLLVELELVVANYQLTEQSFLLLQVQLDC